jgi:hypothetical protein
VHGQVLCVVRHRDESHWPHSFKLACAHITRARERGANKATSHLTTR